jgi:hypothetical protein
MRTLRHDNYTIGWICALPTELTAAKAMLDEKHTSSSGDFNAGIILFRNSAWSRHFLSQTWSMRHDGAGSEQDAMKNC